MNNIRYKACYLFLLLLLIFSVVSCKKTGIPSSVHGTLHTPDLINKINYVDWFNDFVKIGKIENADQIYWAFWNGCDDLAYPPQAVKSGIVDLTKHIWAANDYPEIHKYITRSMIHIEESFRPALLNANCTITIEAYPDYPDCAFLGTLPDLSASKYAICVLLANALNDENFSADMLLSAWDDSLRHISHMEGTGSLIAIRYSMILKSIVQGSMEACFDANLVKKSACAKLYDMTHAPLNSEDYNRSLLSGC